MEVQLLGYLRQIEALKQRLESENIYLRDEVKHLLEHTDIVGQSAAMEKVLTEAKQVAGTDTGSPPGGNRHGKGIDGSGDS